MQLLNQAIRRHLFFSAFLIITSIPFSYYFLNRLIVNEAEEVLEIKQKRLYIHLSSLSGPEALTQFFKTRDDISMKEVPTLADAADSLYRNSEYDSLSNENTPYLRHSYGISLWGKVYRITQQESLIQERALIILLLKVQITLLVILLSILLWINYRFSQMAWKPFYRTLQQLQQYEVDKDITLELPASRIKEFNDLNETIRSIAEKSNQTYKAQKEFTENAAHEIQTPLAVFQSKLEVLMQKEHLTGEDADLIDSLTEVGDRLSRISKGLLLLTKIDNKQFIGKDPIGLADFMNKLLASFEGQLKDNAITCHFYPSDGTIMANTNLIDILLANLLSNAIRYNKAGGSVWIRIDKYLLTISNTGENIPIEISRMYGRFAKSGKNAQSIGLGLSIVKKICDVCNYTLTYQFNAAEETHSFSVLLTAE